jgi:hypothetical protein
MNNIKNTIDQHRDIVNREYYNRYLLNVDISAFTFDHARSATIYLFSARTAQQTQSHL